MPSTIRVTMRERLDVTNAKLVSLFDELHADEALQHKLRAINQYYKTSLARAKSSGRAHKIIESYELLVDKLSQVRRGEITGAEAAAFIKRRTRSKKESIVFHNLLNLCELLLWSAVAVATVTLTIGLALPWLIIEPFSGFLITLGLYTMYCGVVNNIFTCFDSFKSFSRLDAEAVRETSLISFFNQPAPQFNQPIPQYNQPIPEFSTPITHVTQPSTNPELSIYEGEAEPITYPDLF